jgi:L-ascorbate metabolism protein UlaG (beta-lactamase superfamily)
MRSVLLAIVAAIVIGSMPAHAQGVAPAQPSAKSEIPDSCPGLVAERPSFRSIIRRVALNADQVRLTYIGHSTFLIETPQGVRIATDYNGYVKPPMIPDVVTMNHAHSTHYTDSPEPEIRLVLRGWSEEFGKPARIDRQFKDVRIRNVPTNIRSYYGSAETERHGNSIFIFEVAGLCIVHLGHLHHTLNAQQLSEVGRPDIVLVPVDGSYTLDLDGMIEVLRGLKARMVSPMHYFSEDTLDRFLAQVGREWEVTRSPVPSVLLSKATLPGKPRLLVLPGH